ncbi:uncharacterized protein PHACADRAFT_214230 [Phanerochaete carnosa HHB-10118-sp]|uniref:non-specific serine/threonine protein kinase n=1 Tax=Phanerochaete carnosa (strain HHB-10118-sp) TaxID=650164 RepID=K5VEX5_PHACS|nr:uncharacterized protein PHACADRAFT_214230 [Phanerochaete carnosa HHB-10118-sp]EKM49713.1 hypothetical protein PHACADRAFT_214230 [Phanerochaete carnosa HHB-10118-sp]
MTSPPRYLSSHKMLSAFQLGDSLGKGAFGQVYRALNWETGETVAVKEIQLSNIPKSEIGQIMSEINLLKNLNHPNIVKYKGYEKTPEFLYIILEFCENGSLHNICKRFGKFPETLVGVYISQVLEGLMYLHEQGVIHRDIKGANILTNKDGCVKLADFGVASNAAATAVRENEVVGSPYWMAPEVIEQSGATTASDIWSVGCTVIELLEGKPPYHFLDPMPALFRIVQDDCPPIPEGASPVVKDFLYHCFQKDPNLRVSAKKLLKHPWMAASKRQISGDKGADSSNKRPLSNYNFNEAVLKVQEWNEALKSPSKPAKHPTKRPNLDGDGRHSPLQPLDFGPASKTPLASSQGLSASNSGQKPASLLLRPNPTQAPKTPAMPTPLGHIPLEKTTTEGGEEKQEVEDNGQTIRPSSRSPSVVPSPLPVSKPPAADIEPIVEDLDFDFAEDDDNLQAKVADFKKKISVRRGLFHPDDIKIVGLMPTSPGPKTAPLPVLSHKPSRPSLNPLSSGSSTPSRGHQRSSSSVGSNGGSAGRAEARRLHSQSEFGKYTEDDDEDYEDIFDKVNGNSTHPMQTLQLNTRLSNESWLGDDDDDEDPFADIDEGFAEEDLESNLQRDKYARLCNSVNLLIDELTPSAPDFQLREACDQLLAIIVDAPEMQSQLVSAHGMLAIMEVLESRISREVALRLLQIVNALVTSDMGFLESFCLIGGIPVMMEFTSKKHSPECRLEASNFIRLLCHSSVLTLQMFISCRGLRVLVDLLDEDYTEQSQLVIHALNGICSVFELQSPTTKNDFCRMFIREGLLDPLSSALLNIMTSRGETAAEMNGKIIQIVLVFCQVSQSDIHVRNALGTRKVVRRLLRACELLEPEYLVNVLKAVKHLSMSATLLEVLQNANAIDILVKILEEQSSGPYSAEICNHVFQTCYNLCRLNKSRQEEAAQAGIVPCLVRVLPTKSPLKQFALPILCDLASASKSCRILLWQHDGFSLYVKLLDDPYFQVSALEAIFAWLTDETHRIEDQLLKPDALDALLRCFVNSKANSFENLLEAFYKLCRVSTLVTIGIAKSQFFKRTVEKLGHSKPHVRLHLLKLLKWVCEVHPNRATLIERFGLHDVVRKLSADDPAVLVRQLAGELLPLLAPALRPAHARRGKGTESPKAAIAPKKMRRTASEGAASIASPLTGRHVRAATRAVGGLSASRATRQSPSDASFLSDVSSTGTSPR